MAGAQRHVNNATCAAVLPERCHHTGAWFGSFRQSGVSVGPETLATRAVGAGTHFLAHVWVVVVLVCTVLALENASERSRDA